MTAPGPDRRPDRAPGASARALVELRDDRVVKTQDPAIARVEAEKSRLGAEIGERCGLFAVPRLLSQDPEAGRLVFAKVPGLRPLRALLGQPGWQARCDRAAAALVEIHAALRLPGELARRLPATLDGELSPVFLHGDYSPTNLQVQEGSDQLWILDWSAPAWLPPLATQGAPSLDLAAFVLPLFWQRPGDPLAVPRPELRAERFLRAWAAKTGLPLGPVIRHAQRLSPERQAYAASLLGPLGRLLRLPMQGRSWHFLRGFAAQTEGDEPGPQGPIPGENSR